MGLLMINVGPVVVVEEILSILIKKVKKLV